MNYGHKKYRASEGGGDDGVFSKEKFSDAKNKSLFLA